MLRVPFEGAEATLHNGNKMARVQKKGFFQLEKTFK